MTEEPGKEEEKFEFTSEGETLGYISLDEARVLAIRTAAETPGAYGRHYRNTPMVFEVETLEETDDFYEVTLSFMPQGNFVGETGREQFVVAKEGTIALRQVLSLPTQTSASPAGTVSKGGGSPILPVAIGAVFVSKWGTQGSGDGQFVLPEGVAAVSDGNVYVADTENHRIQKFTSEGLFVSRWGKDGSGDGEFDFPVGVAVAPDGNVYVAEWNNRRIQKFSVGQ